MRTNPLVLLIGVLFASAASAQSLYYAGQLVDACGKPMTGDVKLALSYWDAPTGGNLLYGENPAGDIVESTTVTLQNGHFSVDTKGWHYKPPALKYLQVTIVGDDAASNVSLPRQAAFDNTSVTESPTWVNFSVERAQGQQDQPYADPGLSMTTEISGPIEVGLFGQSFTSSMVCDKITQGVGEKTVACGVAFEYRELGQPNFATFAFERIGTTGAEQTSNPNQPSIRLEAPITSFRRFFYTGAGTYEFRIRFMAIGGDNRFTGSALKMYIRRL